jgi:hypothetical protein
MSDTNTFARSLHDVGLAAWFGGSLMGAIGLNGAAARISDPTERAKIATAGWKRWAPVSATAIGAHLVGVGTWTTTKTVLTVAALAATAASGVAGGKLAAAADRTPVQGATEPSSETPAEVATAQKTLRPLQWAIPVLTGALLVASARMGEQQRPAEVASGLFSRFTPG